MAVLYLESRAEEPERMDDRSIGGRELEEALLQLGLINRLLGAAWVTLEGVVRLWRGAGRPARLHLLDVGAGAGDLNRLLLRWGRLRGVDLRVTLLDIHPETCAHAARRYRDEPRVQVEQGDLFHLPPGRADIVTASLVLHHLATPELPSALLSLRRAARLGVVVNDLHRHPLAAGLIGIATRLLSRNPMIRHDAPLSVRRGFRAAELEALRSTPGLEGLRWRWRPFFRYLITLPGEGERCGI
ncbi:MAG: methyltransferase domain-containing protein [Bacillota bacterium]